MVVTVMVLASRRAKKTALEDYGFAENMKRTGAYIIGANREEQGVERLLLSECRQYKSGIVLLNYRFMHRS